MTETKIRLPMQPVHIDEHGTLRFVQNKIVRDLLDHSTAHNFSLNDIAMGVHSDRYTREEIVQLDQLIGYSVSGFGSLSYVSNAEYETANKLAELPDERDATIAALTEQLDAMKKYVREAATLLFNVADEDLQ